MNVAEFQLVSPLAESSAAPPVAEHPNLVFLQPQVLHKETNARFWASTNFKVGQELDAENPIDRAMSKVWMDIYAKVKQEDAEGRLVLTHEHPPVKQHLQDAAVANAAAVAHVHAATKATSAGAVRDHVQAAATATAMGKQSAKKAAAHQPPTASPAVAHAAAIEAHAAVAKPPPGVVAFPVGHPVHWHPSAQPSHPDLATPAPPPVDPWDVQSVEDHVGIIQAGEAPANVGDTFENAPIGPSPPSTQIITRDDDLPRFPERKPHPAGKEQIRASTQKILLVAGAAVSVFALIVIAVKVGTSNARVGARR